MKTKYYFFFFLLVTVYANSRAQPLVSLPNESFFQEIKTEIALSEVDENVLKLFKVQDAILAITPGSIYKFQDGKWDRKTTKTPYLSAVLDAEDQLWLLSGESIQQENTSRSIKLPNQLKGEAILSLLWEGKTLHAGTTAGMFTFKNDSWAAVRETQGKRVNSIALDTHGVLWVATNRGLLKRTPKEWQNLDEMLMAVSTEENYFALHLPQDTDDLLFSAPYYSLANYARDDPYWPYFQKSIERTWAACQSDRMPTWNIIASVFLQKDCDLEIAREELALFPMDLVDWKMTNSHRWDLVENALVGRGRQRQATQAIPTPEARIFRWNTNPYQLDSGANGTREVTGTYFLLSYWMARYHQLFE